MYTLSGIGYCTTVKMERPRRICQQEALTCVATRCTAGEVETNLSLCTGAGKSIILLDCSQLEGVNRGILVFPSLLLLKQYWKDHKAAYASMPHYYLATDGTLAGVPRLTDTIMKRLSADQQWIICTTYTSAPIIYVAFRANAVSVDLVAHDEAHHVGGPEYATGWADVAGLVRHTVNLSATLPDSKVPNYKYPLLKGIRDKVVRDFNLELFLCTMGERTGAPTALLVTIIEKLRVYHERVRLLIYTAQANTEGADVSSVKTFLTAHGDALRTRGWWIDGINEDTRDRDGALRNFEHAEVDVAILVSCRTLSEGIDLHGANCMLPWDPTASVVDNIQRIGRVLRLYKNAKGVPLAERHQTPSTICIPVFLPEAEYVACGGDRAAVDALLTRQVAEGERGNFRSIVNVCTALKSELAEEDSELFNQLLAYPYKPRVAVTRGLAECVAAAVKRPVEDVLEEVADAIAAGSADGAVDEDLLESVREGEWTEEEAGAVVGALASTQGLTLVVRDGDEEETFGTGGKTVTVAKKADGSYAVKKGAAKGDTVASAAAKQRIAHRLRVEFSEGCRILLGLESIEGADAAGGMILARLTAEVRMDEDWEKRRLEWVAMYETLGRCPSKNSKDPTEKKAATWQSNQRNSYKKKDSWMTPTRIAILDTTPGWMWEAEDTWEPSRLHWIAMNKKLGRCPSAKSQDPDERKAGSWQSIQRKSYKKKDSWLTSTRIAILNATPGWKWDNKDKWELTRIVWEMWVKEHKSFPTQKSSNKQEKCLACWQHGQRMAFRNKHPKLTAERIDKLNHTFGWVWEEDTWEVQRLHWCKVYSLLGRFPKQQSTNPEERKAAKWQSHQRENKKNHKLDDERIRILDETEGWAWEEDSWEDSRQLWISVYRRLGRQPTHTIKCREERKAAIWQRHQRTNYIRKNENLTDARIAILNATPGWTWSADEAPADVPDTIQHVTDDPPPAPTPIVRKRRVAKEPVAEKPTQTPVHRQRSQLEEYHKRFKTMNANTYAATIATSPTDFTAYHTVADAYDARDPPERQPLHKIAALLAPFNKRSYTAVDLGCGMNRLRHHGAVSRMSWDSVDVHATDDTVTVADMGALPFEDETYDIAVLSRSLWARNHDDVLREVHRILKVGGRVIICESFQRWLSAEDQQNTLLVALRSVGFEILMEEGTQVGDATEDVFQYIVARRM